MARPEYPVAPKRIIFIVNRANSLWIKLFSGNLSASQEGPTYLEAMMVAAMWSRHLLEGMIPDRKPRILFLKPGIT